MGLTPAPAERGAGRAGRHFAIVAPPLPGHWDPLTVLARELTGRGHKVTFVHMADAGVMVAGEPEIGFEAVGRTTHGSGALARYKETLARASGPRGFFEMIGATAGISDMLLADLPDALRGIGAEAVIADETELAGAMAARHLGLPYVTSVTGLPLLREPDVPPPFVGWPLRMGPLGRRRNAGGHGVADLLMRPIRRVHARAAERWGLDLDAIGRGSPLLQVAQCPRTLDFPRRMLPPSFRYCGPFRAAEQAPVALPEGPLVYCSLGSLQGNRPELFAAMTQACADLGARAVVAHGGLLDEAAARALPGNPVVGAYWVQPAVLPQCTAAILHGGFNTVLDALAAGVPMVVVPLAFEQPGTAARVARSGAGHAITGGRLGRARLRGGLERVLGVPSYREAARRLGGEMAGQGGAPLAADLIDEAIRIGRTPLFPA